LECGGINKVVDLPGHPVALVDSRDLGREQEAHPRLAAGRGGPPQLRLEAWPKAEQAWLGGLARLGELRGPGRVGEVAGADYSDTFAHRPPGQRPGVAVLAAGPGEARVDVQVRVKHAARYCHAAVTLGGGFGRAARRVARRVLPRPARATPGPRQATELSHGNEVTPDMIMALIPEMRLWPRGGPGSRRPQGWVTMPGSESNRPNSGGERR